MANIDFHTWTLRCLTLDWLLFLSYWFIWIMDKHNVNNRRFCEMKILWFIALSMKRLICLILSWILSDKTLHRNHFSFKLMRSYRAIWNWDSLFFIHLIHEILPCLEIMSIRNGKQIVFKIGGFFDSFSVRILSIQLIFWQACIFFSFKSKGTSFCWSVKI